jgi:hypothetical protein
VQPEQQFQKRSRSGGGQKTVSSEVAAPEVKQPSSEVAAAEVKQPFQAKSQRAVAAVKHPII